MINNSKLSIVLVILMTLALTVGGCAKKEDNTPQPDSQDSAKTETKTEMPAIELTPAHSPGDEVKPDPKVNVDPAQAIENAKKLIDEAATPKEGDIWIQDYEQALKLAAAQGKDIIMDFTGSDWCGWCIKLDEEVFAKQEFIDVVPNKFVLLKLDYPQDKSIITEEVKIQNEALQKKYPVAGFPTIFVTDAQGRPYAQTGYQEGGPEKYIEHLNKLQATKIKMDELIKKAGDQAAAGADKAKFIDEALTLLPDGIASIFYGSHIDQIIELDAENKAGLKDKYVKLRKIDALRQEMTARNYEKVIELADATIAEIKPTADTLQEIYLIKSEAFFRSSKKDQAKETLEKALKAAPDTEKAELIKDILARLFPEEKAAEEVKPEETEESK